jgi:recombination protein RecA
MEKTFDADWAKRQGVDTHNLELALPDTGEEAVDIVCALMDTWEISLVVIDSIPTLVPMKMAENSAEDKTVGVLSALMGVFCSKIVTSWARERKRNHHVTLVFTNQFRSKIGMMFGDPRTLPGGQQINHLSTTKVELKNKEIIETAGDNKDMLAYNEHSFRITKGKTGASFRNGEFQMAINPVFELPSGLVLEQGLPTGTILDAATVATHARKFEIVTGAGSSWRMRDVDQKFGSLPEIEKFLYSNEEEFLRLKQRVIAAHRVSIGLPALPPDGYLLDWNAKDNVTVTE